MRDNTNLIQSNFNLSMLISKNVPVSKTSKH